MLLEKCHQIEKQIFLINRKKCVADFIKVDSMFYKYLQILTFLSHIKRDSENTIKLNRLSYQLFLIIIHYAIQINNEVFCKYRISESVFDAINQQEIFFCIFLEFWPCGFVLRKL